jgi:hypothetical protein
MRDLRRLSSCNNGGEEKVVLREEGSLYPVCVSPWSNLPGVDVPDLLRHFIPGESSVVGQLPHTKISPEAEGGRRQNVLLVTGKYSGDSNAMRQVKHTKNALNISATTSRARIYGV